MMGLLDLVLHVRVGRHARKHECKQHQTKHTIAITGPMDGLRGILSQIQDICDISERYGTTSRSRVIQLSGTFSGSTRTASNCVCVGGLGAIEWVFGV